MNLWGQGVSDWGPIEIPDGFDRNSQWSDIAPASQGICKPSEKPTAGGVDRDVWIGKTDLV